MQGRVNRAGRRLLDALLPQHCALCGLRSHRALPLCPDCEAELSPNPDCCARCAIPLPPALPADAMDKAARSCGNCLRKPPPFAQVIAPWLYSEYLGQLIHLWKFSGELGMTPLLATLWLQRAEPAPVDVLVPVPLHWWRQWRRGFNQSELLARQLQRSNPTLAAVPIDTRLLLRQRATAVQSGSNAQARAQNLRGAFTVGRPCDNLRIAVIDDVFTTGATATEVAGTLSRAGASHIEIWCLARTPAPGA